MFPPETPNKRSLIPTPLPSSSPCQAMDCTTVVDKFNIIQIHTAKCSKCDKRNKEKMRRCPGCTFQICQPCFHAQNGQPLHHGNSSLRFAALATPPRRSPASRRIHGAGVAAGNGEVANQDAGPNAVPTGKGLRPDGIGALDANAGAGAGPESSSPMTVNAETNAANAQAPSNPPMKETPPQNLFGSEKRACTITAKKTAAGKRTATAMNSDSDEYFPTTASANTDSKRCKSIAQNTPAVGQQIRLPACSPRRQTRAANTKVYFVDMPSPHGLAPAAGSRNDAPLTTGYDSESDHDHDHRGERSSLVKEGLAPKPSSTRKVKKSVKGRRYIPLYQPRFPSSAPLGSIQQLLEEAGVNTADKPYIEHPLSRHMPVTQNPVTGFELPICKPEVLSDTLRQFVTASAKELSRGKELDEDKKSTLIVNMTETAVNMSAGFTRRLAYGKMALDMDLKEAPNNWGQEVKNAVWARGEQTLEGFADEGRPKFAPSESNKRKLHNPETTRQGALPPVGYFYSVSPSRTKKLSPHNL